MQLKAVSMTANDANSSLPLKRCGNELFKAPSPQTQTSILDSTHTKVGNNKENSLMQLDKRFADLKKKRLSLNGIAKPKRLKNNVKRDTSLPPDINDYMKNSLNETRTFDKLLSKQNHSNSGSFDSMESSETSKLKVKAMIPDTQIINSINSSPLSSKRFDTRGFQMPEKFKSTLKIDISNLKKTLNSKNREILDMSSSPIKAPSTPRLRKQVAFSSDVESEPLSSSPLKGCPRKSILKVNDEILSDRAMSLEEILKQDLTRNESWQVGLVLQIPYNYPGLESILVTLGKAVQNSKFNRLYEVYATLNHLIKSNPKILLSYSYFSQDTLISIIAAVKRNLFQIAQDIQASDAFKLRTTSQGLKLLTSLSSLTASMPNLMTTIYDYVIKLMMNEYISKGLTISILQFVKVIPEALYNKIETISLALIQMKYFTSASISAEKLNILKKYLALQPALTSKCGYQLFSFVIYSIINTDVPAYGKILNSATSLLTVAARNSESKETLYRVLSETLDDSYDSLKSNAETCLKSWMTVSQALCETLNYLIHLELYAQAAKTWSYLLFMVSYERKGFLLTEWDNYQYFTTVFKKLYSHQGGIAFAVEAWKSVIYNFQISNTSNWDTEKYKTSLDAILLPFKEKQLCSDDKVLKQWTDHQGYLTLYYRLVYSVMLHLEQADKDEHKSLLLDTMLFPLTLLKEHNEFTKHFFKHIFGSINIIAEEKADSCFWLSDVEKWKSTIFSVSKDVLESKTLLKALIKFALKCTFTGLCIPTINCLYEILDSLKLSLSEKEHEEASLLVADLLNELVEKKDQDKLFDYPKLINGANETILFHKRSQEAGYLLVNVINTLCDQGHTDSLHDFCKGKIGSVNVALMILLSKFEHQEIVLNFDYNSCSTNVPVCENVQLTLSDEELIIDRLESLLTSSCDYKTTLIKLIQFLEKTHLFHSFKPISKFSLFKMMLSVQVTQSNIQCFYRLMPTPFLDMALDIFSHFNNDVIYGQKLARFLLYFTEYNSIPPTWISIICKKLTYLLHEGITLESSIVKFIVYMFRTQPDELYCHFKKKANVRQLDISRFEKYMEGADSSVPDDQLFTEITCKIDEIDFEFSQKNDKTSLIKQDSQDQTDALPTIDDMKSFIIDSIKEDSNNSLGASCGTIDPNIDHLSNYQRINLKHQCSDNFDLDEKETNRKRKKKERRKKRKERKNRKAVEVEVNQTSESEIESFSLNDWPDSQVPLPRDEFLKTPSPDLLQLRTLLKKLNTTVIEMEDETREDLEKDLVIMLAKLKHANIQ